MSRSNVSGALGWGLRAPSTAPAATRQAPITPRNSTHSRRGGRPQHDLGALPSPSEQAYAAPLPDLRGIGWKGKRCAGGCTGGCTGGCGASMGAGGCTGTGCGSGGGGSVLYGGGGTFSSSSGTRGARACRTRRRRAGSSVWHSALATLRSLSVCTALFTFTGASCTSTMFTFTFTLDTFCRLGSPGTRTETESDLRRPGAGTGSRISM